MRHDSAGRRDVSARIVIAEDNYLVREGTRRLLEDTGEIEVLAAVGDAESLCRAVQVTGPDAVITDIRMPPRHHMEGIGAAHRIRASNPGVGVVVLSQHADPAYAVELFKNGTAGLAYLLKERIGDLDALLRSISEVIAGRSVLDSEIVDALIARRSDHAGGPNLTPREHEVLHHMAQGRTNAGIATALFLSESAIEKHVNAIFSKLELREEPRMHRRVSAVLRYLQEGP